MDTDRTAGRPPVAAALLQSMRPHQWVKNLLVFVPLLAAHRYGDAASALQALLAWVAFTLAASGVYLFNDLADLADDRLHARKRLRPLAAGRLDARHARMMGPALLVAAFALSLGALPAGFTATLAAYFVLATGYSLRLKRVAILDVLALAALYTLRIIAGAAAVAVPLSFWLLAFSMFLFLSLAFLKRYAELRVAPAAEPQTRLRGRGYEVQDIALVSSLGCGAGYIAVLVLALYIQDARTAGLYATPTLIWLACPLMLYWISRAWLEAHRGRMHDDPLVFALKDPVSWVVAALFMLLFLLARADLASLTS